MRKLLFVMLVLLLVVPATNSFSASFKGTGFWAENRYYDDTDQSQYFMIADATVDTNAHDVFVKIPSWSGSSNPGGEYQKLNIMPWFGDYDAGKGFSESNGYDLPGGAYENIDINYFIDTNDNGAFDSTDVQPSPPLQPNPFKAPSGTFSQLSLVDNVKVDCVGSNVSVSWNGIPLGDHPSSQYKVRVIDQHTNEFYVDSGRIDIDPSNNYLYGLDLSAYIGADLYIGIEARQGLGDIDLANRSRYYAAHSPVPEPTTMLLLGAGLVGLAGFGRKRFKK